MAWPYRTSVCNTRVSFLLGRPANTPAINRPVLNPPCCASSPELSYPWQPLDTTAWASIFSASTARSSLPSRALQTREQQATQAHHHGRDHPHAHILCLARAPPLPGLLLLFTSPAPAPPCWQCNSPLRQQPTPPAQAPFSPALRSNRPAMPQVHQAVG